MTTGGRMSNASAVQTIWCELLVGTLVDAGVMLVVISPGSRSTPLVTALATEALRRESSQSAAVSLVTIIDERAAAFYALGAARATNQPVALVCTSGTAGAHYLPALIEAHQSNIPLIVITADRPPELLDCGASQTIDQVGMFGRFVRQSFDVGAPVGTPIALRALRRKMAQAIVLARGPLPGPVHLEVPLRKPLEPIAPATDEDRELASLARSLRGPLAIAPPRLAPDSGALIDLAEAISAEPDGVIVVGALPISFTSRQPTGASACDLLLALARRAGYPIIAESGSQLRVRRSSPAATSSATTFVDHIDLIPVAHRPPPRLVLQLGAEPVAASWPQWDLSRARRWVLAPTWADPTSTAHVLLGDVALSLESLIAQVADRSSPNASFSNASTASSDVLPSRASQQRVRTSAWLDTWRELDIRAAGAIDRALADHPRSEGAAIRAAIAGLTTGTHIIGTILQIGNSLPIRVIDHVAPHAPDAADAQGVPSPAIGRLSVITQRGAAGIDGLIASAAGATHAGRPVLLVLGDVSFAHDVGGLLAARRAKAPLAILVVDNRGGQIFAGLPVAKAGIDASVVAEHWLTAPELDPAAVATAMGLRAITTASAAAITTAIADALSVSPAAATADAMARVTVIHAPVSATGAHDVRRAAIALMEKSHAQPQPTRPEDHDRSSYVDAPRGL
ncbi:MAG: 2-succinyl-5-enolpyruvyl-6-hydroxy-3-cyclohexene-1-carboxylic-acid synthase [Kofleriaceae bacterium]